MLALSCAAVGDVTAWCLLAFVVGVAQSAVAGAISTALLTVLFIGVMFGVVRPLARRWLGERDPPQINGQVLTTVLLALLLSSLAAEAIGIHALFGAFLLGAVIPHESRSGRAFHDKLHDMVVLLLLPAFFALRAADANRIGQRPVRLADVRSDHRSGDARKAWRHHDRRAVDRQRLANVGVARNLDEHARIDGVDRAQHRPRFGSHLANAVRDDGPDGAGHDGGDNTDLAVAESAGNVAVVRLTRCENDAE